MSTNGNSSNGHIAQEVVSDEEPKRLRLGGMAMANGLLVYGPTSWAAAVRTSDGRLIARSGHLPRLSNKVDGMPGVRGVVRMGEAMAVLPLVRMHMPEARFAFERLSVLGTVIATSTAAMAVKRFGGKRSSTDFAVSLLGLVPAIVSLRSGNVAEYHGAEHKAIAAYEVDGDAADQSKEHDRCGSHLMAPMMLSSLAGDALLRNVFKNESAAAQAGVALAGVASSVEMFAWADRHPKSAFARLFHKPGHELQRVMGTREPTREQLDVAEAAIAELLRAEGHSS